MPRQARIDAPAALHHIIVRGIERKKIFRDDQDRYDFIKRLGRVLEQTQTECCAWALIPNHFHLLLRTGMMPVATVMRRLLTGHAIYFNHRHKRAGHLFQNRYKSILCQEDAYFLELVRYIHLNPLRAKLVSDMDQLGKYPFSGYGVVMGKFDQPWQNIKEVLAYFGGKVGPARRNYRAFVATGIDQGRRSDLTGGGLIRSTGGWASVKAMRKAKIHLKSDEAFDRRHALKARGVDVDYIADRVAKQLGMPVEQIWQPGKYKHLVTARSLLCFWAVRQLGVTMTSMAQRLNISTVAVSKSVERGAQIAANEGYELIKLKS